MHAQLSVTKVPAITFLFWVIKIFSTTLGETGGDALSMTLGLGYILSTLIFSLLFIVLVNLQINLKQFNVYIYWSTIVATTTVGTTLADFVDRSLGIGYLGGTSVLLTGLFTVLFVWYRTEKSLSVNQIKTKRSEWFYWITIIFSQTLGTALGDWTADTIGLGFSNGSILFGLLLLGLAIFYKFTRLSHVFLFWATFVLTRPFGAVLGDFLDKPKNLGGLALDRIQLSSVLIVSMILLIIAQKNFQKIIGLYNNKH
ncbi:MAG: hypothetical protein KGN31_06870 [Betaproteobacteria bacterium]|nr:hypothetical protein [Betaproteobacteria bacterium]